MLKSNILAHRGCWDSSLNKNSREALFKALDLGYGIETDLRDLNGSLVVCHDPATYKNSFPADDLFSHYSKNNCKSKLALNIKSDGLQELLKKSLDLHEISMGSLFVFDMSIPDMNKYIGSGITRYTRLSDYEIEPILIEHCHGVWLDDFNGDINNTQLVEKYLHSKIPVALVSPELHGRDIETLWYELKYKKCHKDENFFLCTDLPNAAFKFFEEEK